MSTSVSGNQVDCTGVLNWLGPEPVTPNWPYCQTMWPKGSTRMTRLSATPPGACGITPGGVPVPAIKVKGPTRWASLQPTMDLAEKSFGPNPNCQTMRPSGSVSMTRLLNWSAIRRLPGWLKWRLSGTLPADAVPARTSAPTATKTEHQAPVETRILL